MSLPRRVVCWRHGRTRWNLEHRYQGQSDIPLDDTGRAQALRAARMLAALRPDMIVSSDLCRAAATADTLAALTGLPVRRDKNLRERFGGSWEGLNSEEISRIRPVGQHEWWEPPDGEPRAEVAERFASTVERVAAELPAGGLAVVVSHGAAIRLGIGELLDLGEDAWGALGGLSNCSWSVLGEARRGWRLLEHNAGSLPGPVHSDDHIQRDEQPAQS